LTQIVNGIHLPDRDTHFREQILNNPIVEGKGTYQYAKIDAALKICKNRNFAIDIGANVGLWTRLLAANFKRVVAIEPVMENVECLNHNIDEDVNVEVAVVGISQLSGRLSLKWIDGTATAYVSAYEDRDFEVNCRPLDDFNFTYVDFIKIDVEGYENNVIKSAERTIRVYKPIIVVEQKKKTVRYDGYKFAAISRLAGWGMSIAWEMSGDYCLVWR